MFHLPQNHLLSRDRTGQINRSHETRRSDRDHENIYGDHGTQFGALTQTADMEEEDGSGVSSPPLWKTSPETEASSPLHHSYPNLSPKSRLQEIARGRQELMEMVHHMPESSYELSLRDIVEQPKVVEERKKWNFESDMENKKKNKKKGQILRSESNDNGTFLLKMFFPTSLGSKGKKVSPKPPLFEAHGWSLAWLLVLLLSRQEKQNRSLEGSPLLNGNTV
ncbi:hypothetical protein HHK36_007904 [Tetracentron sinense]|uniref:Uncharacterized protein n=1 Tax=Tetracentron sinense TaxID=13715 RepID=A0A835DMR3_TETSI|nr:hypothetical protein HHK36_007904 [Tetracentron sinense]